MNNYLKLNLPTDPVKNVDSIINTHITGGYNLVLPHEVLNNNILSIFDNMGLTPRFVVLFGRGSKDAPAETRMIHTDICLTGTDRRIKSSWSKLIFGINWEIDNSYNTFSWWDMSKLDEAWPNEDAPKKFEYLNGIHYVKRGQLGIPPGAVKIEETVIDAPTLVRTNIPHMTVYNNPRNARVGVSVRFKENNFKSWEDVVDFFNPYRLSK